VKIKVAAVTVNWRSGAFIEKCLASIFAQTLPLKVVVVDNEGDEELRRRLTRHWPQLLWLDAGGNRGFAAANNLAFREVTAEYYLLVNPDVTLENNYAQSLLDFMETHPQVGSATGRGLVPGTDPQVVDGLGHFFSRQRITAGYRSGSDTATAPVERFGVCAAYAMYRQEMLTDIAHDGEIFDADLFAYYEDIDIDWRARWRGWQAYYLPAATAWHYRGASGGMGDYNIKLHYYKNRWLLFIKNEALSLALPDLFILVREFYLDWQRWRQDKMATAVLRCLLGNFKTFLHKRIVIRQRRKITPAVMEQWYD